MYGFVNGLLTSSCPTKRERERESWKELKRVVFRPELPAAEENERMEKEIIRFTWPVFFGRLLRVWASAGTPSCRAFPRALSEHFQSSFGAISEQLQISCKLVSEQFQSSFRAVSEQFRSNFWTLVRWRCICRMPGAWNQSESIKINWN